MKEKKKTTIYCLNTTLLIIKAQVICIKNYETEGARNEAQVYLIKEALDKIKEDLKYSFFKNTKNIIKDFKKIINIVQRILYFNQLEQQKGKGLKILTPDQMISRLPITLSQLNARKILKNLKTKLDNYCILCKDKKAYKTTL